MQDFENKPIKLRVHLKGGKIYDFTNILASVKWSGDYRCPYRTLEVSYVRTNLDNDIDKKDITIGSTACFYVGDKEIFRGNCTDINKSSSKNTVDVVFKDIGAFLTDKKSYNFSEKTPVEIVSKILSENKPPLKKGYLAPASTKITKTCINQSAYDIIMTAYTEHSKNIEGRWKYMVKAGLNNINVIEKGVNFIKIQFSEATNLEDVSYKESLNGFVNRVLIVDSKGNKIKEEVNKELLKVYNAYVTEVLTQDDKKGVTADEIKNTFKGTDKSIELTGFGDISCVTGLKVSVKDTYTNLTGIFYVDKDTHIWEGGNYKIELELNFDNLMDEKDIEDNKESSLGDGAVDWGHGVTAKQINKVLGGTLKGKGSLFIKLGNMYKVNPMLVALIMRMECGKNFDSYNARVRFNFGGITKDPKYKNDGKFVKYPDVNTGIERQFRLLSVKYLHDWGKKSIDDIVKIYAPPNENDTAQYISNMKKWYKEETGKTWDNKLLGVGVASEEEARRNAMVRRGSATVEKAIAYAESKIGYGYSQKNRMSESYFDCSSLCYRAYASAGVYDSNKWAFTTSAIHANPSAYGLVKVPISQIERGDILWKSGHAGLYIGGGKTIEAMDPKRGVRYGRSKNFTCGYRVKG